MDKKKMIFAAAAASLGMWIIAGVWHNLIMAKMYENLHASHEGIGLLLIAYLVLSLLMVHIYVKMYAGNNTIRNGLIFGALIGLLWVFPHELAMAGAHGTSVLYVFKNAAWHLIEQGLGGAIMAWALAFRCPRCLQKSDEAQEA